MLDPSKPLDKRILDLFVTAGYTEPQNATVSAADTLASGLVWCISATHSLGPEFELLSDPNFAFQLDKLKVGEVIEAALRSIGCPHSIQAHQIKDLDYDGVYPVVQWLVDRVRESRSQAEDEDEITYLVGQIEEEEHTAQQLEKELDNAENSFKILHADLNELNQKKENLYNAMQHLHEKIGKEGANDLVQRLLLILESLEDIRRQESDTRTNHKQTHSDMQDDAVQLEDKMSSCMESKSNADDLRPSFCDPLEKLKSAKRELATKLRAMLSLKRRLDDVPSPSELVQYERRFSELYVQIQEKLRQTRKCYATYNALLEIKDLMLKETSLLNSINSQFQDAISSPAGRTKLIDSMEGIAKGIQQKLGKAQLAFLTEHKVCDALKEKYAASMTEQRRCSSLLKVFQEEYAKNEKLRNENSLSDITVTSEMDAV